MVRLNADQSLARTKMNVILATPTRLAISLTPKMSAPSLVRVSRERKRRGSRDEKSLPSQEEEIVEYHCDCNYC